jgi:hypothetical protein
MSTKNLSSRYKYDYNIKLKSSIEIDKKLKQLKDIRKMYLDHNTEENSERIKILDAQISILEWVMGDYDI